MVISIFSIIFWTLFNIGNEYNCSVEYAPSQSRPKSEQQSRKDPKVNSIEQGKIKSKKKNFF
jgi:hypothetical protein